MIWKFTLDSYNPARCYARGGWCFQEAGLNEALSAAMGLRAEGRAEAPVPAVAAVAPARAARGANKTSSAPSSTRASTAFSTRAVPSTALRTIPRNRSPTKSTATPRVSRAAPDKIYPSAPRAPSTQQVCTYRGGPGYTHYFCIDLHDSAEHFHVATLQADAFHCNEKCDLKSTEVKDAIAAAHPEAVVLYISWLEVVEGCRGKRLGIAMVVMLQKIIADLCPGRQLIMLLAVMPNGKFMKPHEQEAKMLTAYYEQAGFQRYATKAGTKGISWMTKDCSAAPTASWSYDEVEKKALLLIRGAGKKLAAKIAKFLPKLLPTPSPPPSKKVKRDALVF